jgi:hypothetical protein
MGKFKTIKIESKTIIHQEGMEIEGYIAGVNSGMYGLPYVIVVRTWARKWFWRKFFKREMKLNLMQVKEFRKECDKVIEYFEAKKKTQ